MIHRPMRRLVVLCPVLRIMVFADPLFLGRWGYGHEDDASSSQLTECSKHACCATNALYIVGSVFPCLSTHVLNLCAVQGAVREFVRGRKGSPGRSQFTRDSMGIFPINQAIASVQL